MHTSAVAAPHASVKDTFVIGPWAGVEVGWHENRAGGWGGRGRLPKFFKIIPQRRMHASREGETQKGREGELDIERTGKW